MAKSKTTKSKKEETSIRSYVLQHKANLGKINLIFEIYQVYSKEYKHHTLSYWHQFLNNEITRNKFSHLGSTKHIKTQLNASYLQGCLAQACATLNNHTANIATKFQEFIKNSSINDKDTLHQLRVINSTHSWFNMFYKNLNHNVKSNKLLSLDDFYSNNYIDDSFYSYKDDFNLYNHYMSYEKFSFYYPMQTYSIVDDFGNMIFLQKPQAKLLDPQVKKLAKQIFKHIVDKQRVRFPNLNKPKLVLDSRLFSFDQEKFIEQEHNKTDKSNKKKEGIKKQTEIDKISSNNKKAKRLKRNKIKEHKVKPTFDYWLSISTLEKGKRISIPIKSNQHFEQAFGVLGKTIELDLKQLTYDIKQHHHKSLSKSHKDNKPTHELVNKTIDFVFNKQQTSSQIKKAYFNKLNIPFNNEDNNSEQPDLINNKDINFIFNKVKTIKASVGFDLGLCTFLATSEGQLLGVNWLKKLIYYDKKIQNLTSARQIAKLKVRSKRYDKLIKQVKGFIKSETNRVLNHYFKRQFLNNIQIEKIIIENLNFNQPKLSRKLNRIIKNFGQAIFKEKLTQLSKIYEFKIEELNPAYSSQECNGCGYVDSNNRATQAVFKCLCCGKKTNADVQGARVTKGRSGKNSCYKTKYKGAVLRELKYEFVKRIPSLISYGVVGRRKLFMLVQNNKYFDDELKQINYRINTSNMNNMNIIVNTTEELGLAPMTADNFDKYLLEYYENNVLDRNPNRHINKVRVKCKKSVALKRV